MSGTLNLDATFSALADPTRRAILARLARSEATVMELAKPFEMTQPAISQHLKVLPLLAPAQVLKKRLALTGFRDGKHVVHRWGDDLVAVLSAALRMAFGQAGIVPFDAQLLKRPHK